MIFEFLEQMVEFICDDEINLDITQLQDLKLNFFTNLHKILKVVNKDMVNKTNVINFFFTCIEDDGSILLPIILKNLKKIIITQENIENMEFFKFLSNDKIIKKFESYTKDWRKLEIWLSALKK